MSEVALGFDPTPRTINLELILPTHGPASTLVYSPKYRQIRSSLAEIGLIEPLVVTPAEPTSGKHILLDGHVRLIAMTELGITEATCLIALDDEAYTYNNRVNRLSTVQEHFMIRRAIANGVSTDRLAKALNVDISQINKRVNLLDGICPEVVDLLKDRQFSAELSRHLRKMKPIRQVECAELMLSANNLSVNYASALLAATQPSMLADPKTPKRISGITQEQMARMEREMTNVQAQYRLAEQTYGQDVLSLTLVRGYLKKLLDNPRVSKFLKQSNLDVLEQFQGIVSTDTLEQ